MQKTPLSNLKNIKNQKRTSLFKRFFGWCKKKVLTHKFCIILVLFMVALSFVFSGIATYSASRFNGITIVLDAGHGGRDGGSVGANGTVEKQINLAYTLALKEKLVKAGYRVQLTRKTDDGLYSEFATNKKLSDMKARFEIIKKANPNLMISIHMNSFKDSSARGASTYYRKDDAASQNVANLIQQSLNTYCNASYTQGKVGDYYILNCSYYASVLVECGFISNPEEEKLLNTPEYKDQFTTAIFKGVLLYFGQTSV